MRAFLVISQVSLSLLLLAGAGLLIKSFFNLRATSPGFDPTRLLTLDHVIPRHRGGQHTWDNLVSACKPCNHRKAGHTPQEARMAMRREPGAPRVSIYHGFFQYLSAQHEWRKFVPGYDAASVAAG